MKINKNSLQERINTISKEKGVHANYVLRVYFFDCFIERLAKSQYSDNFVFKGGFYLSRKLGLENRATVDIDFLAYKLSLEKKNIEKIINDIILIDNDDCVSFKFVKIQDIRENDIYGGYNVLLEAKLENVVDKISIDVATGDPITPCASSFKYSTLIDKKELNMKSYNYETILAEKIQTILSRGVLNSRSKDFYDVYIIYKLKWDEIEIQLLIDAFFKTCEYRKTLFNKNDSNRIVSLLSDNKEMKSRWNVYSKKNVFANGLSYEEMIDALKNVLGNILI